MLLAERQVDDFTKVLASDAPAPGGGSAAALAGAVGAALTAMVCTLTAGRKKYAEHEEFVLGVQEEAEALRKQFMDVMDRDTEAFLVISRAYGMPKATDEEITPDCVEMNMINSFLGRIHLASRIFKLDEARLSLIKEGIAYYKSIADVKKRALPYMPEGLTDFRQDRVVSGFTADGRLYLAVWYLRGQPNFTVEIPEGIRSVKLAYPSDSDTEVSFKDTALSLSFKRSEGAIFLEIDLK